MNGFCMMMFLLNVVSVQKSHPLYTSPPPTEIPCVTSFPELKLVFEGKRFDNIIVIKEESQTTLGDLETQGFHRCFQQ
jgi:hypothetical protein